MKDKDVKKMVREEYAKAAGAGCCTPGSEGNRVKVVSCCSPQSEEGEQVKVVSCCQTPGPHEISKSMGYSEEEMAEVPDGSNLGLGCGNPVAVASVEEGETVVDMGAGAGFDCFLMANRVGTSGKVIGVDMTPEMLDKARENAEKGEYGNVEFRLGEIENLPVGDNTADAVISNCVINLSLNKERVFQEAYRVLKPGGRMIISDIVLLEELPEIIRNSAKAYARCISGAVLKDEYIQLIEEAGFVNVDIQKETVCDVEFVIHDPAAKAVMGNLKMSVEDAQKIIRSTASITVQAEKPA